MRPDHRRMEAAARTAVPGDPAASRQRAPERRSFAGRDRGVRGDRARQIVCKVQPFRDCDLQSYFWVFFIDNFGPS